MILEDDTKQVIIITFAVLAICAFTVYMWGINNNPMPGVTLFAVLGCLILTIKDSFKYAKYKFKFTSGGFFWKIGDKSGHIKKNDIVEIYLITEETGFVDLLGPPVTDVFILFKLKNGAEFRLCTDEDLFIRKIDQVLSKNLTSYTRIKMAEDQGNGSTWECRLPLYRA